jgi:uncharacterized protein YjbK
MIIKEKERKLLINISTGKQTYEKLKKLKSIEDFYLDEDNKLEIKDAYWDTKKFILAKKGGYLRFRGKGTGHLITIRHNKDAIIDEVSHPVNDEGINIVISYLRENYGITSTPQLNLPYFTEIFKSIGFEEILRVETERLEKTIFLEDIAIGKIKIDRFHYLYPNEFGPFYELEINSYKKAFHKQVDDFSLAVVKKYKEEIEVSSMSKYLRGINIGYGLNYK